MQTVEKSGSGHRCQMQQVYMEEEEAKETQEAPSGFWRARHAHLPGAGFAIRRQSRPSVRRRGWCIARRWSQLGWAASKTPRRCPPLSESPSPPVGGQMALWRRGRRTHVTAEPHTHTPSRGTIPNNWQVSKNTNHRTRLQDTPNSCSLCGSKKPS